MSPISKALLLALVIGQAAAFPSLPLEARGITPANENESNTGVIKSTTFDPKDQLVDVRPGTKNEFVAPTDGDIRGPCPGLNAAANHGFLPHDGVPNILQTISGLRQAYNMGDDLSAALAVIAVALAGDYLTETWSIGGPYEASIPGLHNPGGISFSHNKYESDGSPGRHDAYLNHGDAHSLDIAQFNKLYQMSDSYRFHHLRQHGQVMRTYSIMNNPYFFSAPFAGLVPTAANEFIINFMSNHSAEEPSGFLHRNVLKEFFSVTGPEDKHVWKAGYEHIPENWYRRPSNNRYDAEKNGYDDALSLLVNPDLAQFGGNMGKTNSFVGVDVGDLTYGAMNAKDLFKGNNLACFQFSFAEAVIPDELAGILNDIQPIINLFTKHIGPLKKALKCPKLDKFNAGLFNKFPGYHYNPKATNPGEKAKYPTGKNS